MRGQLSYEMELAQPQEFIEGKFWKFKLLNEIKRVFFYQEGGELKSNSV